MGRLTGEAIAETQEGLLRPNADAGLSLPRWLEPQRAAIERRFSNRSRRARRVRDTQAGK
jgi:hypothetical protein